MISQSYHSHNSLLLKVNQKLRAIRLGVFVSAILASVFTFLPVHAKDEIKVIAVVNGEPITNFELADRVLFLRASSQLDLAEQELRRDALQGLIGDRLKTQFGKTVVPGIVPQLDGAARQILDQNFGRDGKPGSAILKQLNIPQRTVLNKIKADILWGNSLRQKFKRQFRNIGKSAEQELAKLKQLKSEPQIRFSEIILLPNPNRSLEETEALAEQIIAALNKGADFASIAQQYSDAATSGKGGLVDWVFVSRLPNLVKTPLMAADKGEVVGPLVFGGQVFILRKRDMRELGQMDPLAATVSLTRVVAPTPATASAEQRKQAADMLLQQQPPCSRNSHWNWVGKMQQLFLMMLIWTRPSMGRFEQDLRTVVKCVYVVHEFLFIGRLRMNSLNDSLRQSIQWSADHLRPHPHKSALSSASSISKRSNRTSNSALKRAESS